MSASSPGAAPCIDVPPPFPRRRRWITVLVIVLGVATYPPLPPIITHPLRQALLAALGGLALDLVREMVNAAGRKAAGWLGKRMPKVLYVDNRSGRRRIVLGWT